MNGAKCNRFHLRPLNFLKSDITYSNMLRLKRLISRDTEFRKILTVIVKVMK